MTRVRHIPAALLLVAAGATAAVACGSDNSGSAQGSSPPSPVHTTVTVTVTAPRSAEPQTGPSTPAPATSTPAQPPQTQQPPPQPAQADPATVVTGYFAAINAQDYPTAWSLGGKNLDSSYAHFVQGFADTASDTVRVVSVSGSAVTISLDAAQTDGTTKSFAGTYTVRDGVIVAASVHEV